MVAKAHSDYDAGGGCRTGKAGSPSQVPRDDTLSPGELARARAAELAAGRKKCWVDEPRGCSRGQHMGYLPRCLSDRRRLAAADSCRLEQDCRWRGSLVAVRGGLVGAVNRDIDVDGLLLCESGELGAQLRQVQRRHLPSHAGIAEGTMWEIDVPDTNISIQAHNKRQFSSGVGLPCCDMTARHAVGSTKRVLLRGFCCDKPPFLRTARRLLQQKSTAQRCVSRACSGCCLPRRTFSSRCLGRTYTFFS